jgi:hypothetical protein
VFRYDIHSEYDKFKDVQSDFMFNNHVECTDNNIFSQRSVDFNLERHITKDVADFDICIWYQNSDWLFIEKGESLILLIDNEKISLTGEGSARNRDVYSGSGISELAFYKIDKELIKKLATAKNVEFQIIGKYAVDCKFTKENMERAKDFYNKFGK